MTTELVHLQRIIVEDWHSFAYPYCATSAVERFGWTGSMTTEPDEVTCSHCKQRQASEAEKALLGPEGPLHYRWIKGRLW